MMATEGMVVLKSGDGPEKTLARLVAAIERSGNRIFARIDHAAAAREVGLMLRPTTVIVFGNPKVGTLLMQSGQEIAIDLPLKALVWQDPTGETWLGYNDPEWLSARHHASADARSTIEKIATALRKISREAIEVAS